MVIVALVENEMKFADFFKRKAEVMPNDSISNTSGAFYTTIVRREIATNDDPGFWTARCLANTLALMFYDFDLNAWMCSCWRWKVTGKSLAFHAHMS